MPVKMTISTEVNESIRTLAAEFPVVAARVLNRVGRSTITRASTNIRDIYSMKKSETDRGFRGSTSAAPKHLKFEIKVSGRPQPLLDFGARQTKGGTSAAVLVGRRKTYLHTFIAQMESGHIGVFKRRGAPVVPQQGRYAGRVITRGPRKGQPIKRQKIFEEFRLSVADMFGRREIVDDLTEFVAQKLPQEVMAQLRFYLSRK